MNKQRLNEILNHRQLSEVFYEEKPVWIQEVNDYCQNWFFRWLS